MLSQPGHLGPTLRTARLLRDKGHTSTFFVGSEFHTDLSMRGHQCVDFNLGKFLRQAVKKPVSNVSRNFLEWEQKLENSNLSLLVVDGVAPIFALAALKLGIPVISAHSGLPYSKEDELPMLTSLASPPASRVEKMGVSLRWFVHLNAQRAKRRLPIFHDTYTKMTVHLIEYLKHVGISQSRLDLDWVSGLAGLKHDELVFCPKEFDFPHPARPYRHYVEASIDVDRNEPLNNIVLQNDVPLIYCGLGTQSNSYPGIKKIYEQIIGALNSITDCQAIVATGNLDLSDIQAAAHVHTVKWAPQLSLLKRAHVMISHGGLNSTKECVFFGVPQLIIPMRFDQRGNAARVKYHNLGLYCVPRDVLAHKLRDRIGEVVEKEKYKRSSEAMSERFHEIEEAAPSVDVMLAKLSG